MSKSVHSPVKAKGAICHQIAEALRQEIRGRYRPGDKLPTMHTLRRQFDVSINTIGQALNLLAKEGLVESWQGSGVYVAERTQKLRVGIVSELDLLHPLTSRFYHHLLWHLRAFFRLHEIQSRLYIGESQPAVSRDDTEFTGWHFADDLAGQRLDGVIALQPDWRRAWLPAAESQGLPLVGTTPDFAHAVWPDGEPMIRAAVRQLAGQGCRRLAYLGWSPQRYLSTFTASVRELGLPVWDGWVRHDLHPDLDGAGWEEFREIWTANAEKPDGLIIGDDILSVAAVGAIQELGIRVPEQLRVAVAGNRGSGIRYPFPVTVLELDPAAMAQQVGAMMLHLLRHEPVAAPQVRVPYRLVPEQPDQPVPQMHTLALAASLVE